MSKLRKEQLLYVYSIPVTMLTALHGLSHLAQAILEERNYYHFYHYHP